MLYSRAFQRFLTMVVLACPALLNMACGDNISTDHVISVDEKSLMDHPSDSLIDQEEMKNFIKEKKAEIFREAVCWSPEYQECFVFSLSFSFPVVQLNNQIEFEKRINKEIAQIVEEEVGLFQQKQQECGEKPADTSGYAVYRSSTIVNIELLYSDSLLLSFSYLWQYHDELAVTPWQSVESGLNYDRINEKRIYLTDLFLPVSEKYLSEFLATDYQVSSQKVKIDLTKSKEYEFFIEKTMSGETKLQIHFPPFTTWYDTNGNEHYTGRSGRIKFEVPVSDLIHCLNPEGVMRQAVLQDLLIKTRRINCLIH